MNAFLTAALDWWWLAPLAGAGLVAYRLFGWRGLLAIVTLGAASGLYTKGKRDERDRLERLNQAERLRAVKDRKAVNDEINSLDPDSVRDRLSDWVPDDPPR